MKNQPNRDYISNDEIMTPSSLAKMIVEHFKPSGRMLEPCCGNGIFLEYMTGADWCEINKGRDFFEYDKKVDWIITNPPWSQIRKFLQHSMSLANNIVFLVTINHLWTRARLRDINDAGFGIKEIVSVKTPSGFPQSGFQLGFIHLQKDYNGTVKCNINEIDGEWSKK